MSEKIIVTNVSALNAKYGAAGAASILTAVDGLIAADAGRGLDTELVALDDAAAMQSVGGNRVSDPASTKQNKDAIDAICNARNPDYLMILGSIDIVPHQLLINPMYTPWRDEDQEVASDLPYACPMPHSNRISDFVGATRVVGRLPDITGQTDPAYLLRLLATAMQWRPRPPADYSPYFSVCASDWQSVTATSLEWIFGNSTSLNTCPLKGDPWPAADLAPLLHFINCHGDPQTSMYFGSAPNFPTALDAAAIAGKGIIREGTVGIAECCYGAELYDPAWIGPGAAPGMANAYLGEGAYAFVGSSSTSYGPEVGSAGSGLICQTFAYYLREGASTGRALLQARHDFIQAQPVLTPIDLKTLAQFNLFGDPSIHCVAVPEGISTDAPPSTAPPPASGLEAAVLKLAAGRTLRRDRLMKFGAALASITPFTSLKRIATPTARSVRRRILNVLRSSDARMPSLAWKAFPVRRPPASIFASAKSWKVLPKELHLAIGLMNKAERVRRRVVLMAYEQDDIFVVRRYLGR